MPVVLVRDPAAIHRKLAADELNVGGSPGIIGGECPPKCRNHIFGSDTAPSHERPDWGFFFKEKEPVMEQLISNTSRR
jgi:hypothetical protein